MSAEITPILGGYDILQRFSS